MKALIVSQYFYPETFRVNTIATELVKRGHDVTVLTGYPQYPQGKIYDGYGFNKPYAKEWNGVKVERVKMRPRGKTPIGLLLNCYTYVSQGKRWVRKCKEKFDVIYVFEVSPVTVGLPAVAYKKKFGTPILFNLMDLWPENVEVVFGIHNRLILGAINGIVNKIYKASDKILCATRAFVENTVARGVPREKTVFWPQLFAKPELGSVSRPACYSDAHFNIVFTGNIGEAQGLDLLVETAEKLKDTNVRWFLVGDGRARERLQKKVEEKHLTDLVTFVGKVTEAEANCYTYFADCAYLSLQKNKVFDMTLPAKLSSYLACGTPILAAMGGESAHMICEAQCGFVSEQTPDALADTILNEVLPSTEEKLTAMRENARKCFCEIFEMDMLMDKLSAMMEEVVQKTATP